MLGKAVDVILLLISYYLMTDSNQLDTPSRPQDDLYHYANAGWLAANPLPAHEARWGTFVKLREDNWIRVRDILEELGTRVDIAPGSFEQKARDFYLSAKDPHAPEAAGLSVLNKWFAEINAFQSIHDVSDYFIKLYTEGVAIVWGLAVEPDEKNSTQYVLRIFQGGLGLPNRDYYFTDDAATRRIREEYALHIPRMMALTGPVSESLVTDVLAVERALAEASMTTTEIWHDLEAQYNKFSLSALQELAPNISWAQYFTELGMHEESVFVNQPKFLQALNRLLGELPVSVWQNYLRWQLTHNSAQFLGERFEQERFSFYGAVLNGTKVIQPRWKRVVLTMDSTALGEGLGKLFVEKYFPNQAKAHMEILVADLKEAFKERIQSNPWMEEKTKQIAIDKLQKMQLKIGYPKVWRSYDLLEVGEGYLANVLRADLFEQNRMLKRLGTPVDMEEWLMTPQTVNAYAYFNLNEIVFPAGILQPPFFDLAGNDAENYGAIGSVIGHEMTHGFDDSGSQFDAQGNRVNWRTEQDKEKFDALSKVLEEQGSAFEVLPGLFMNGPLTIGESMADLGGLEIALDAFERSLARQGITNEVEKRNLMQRLFVSWALFEAEHIREEKAREFVVTDPHPAAVFRINGIASNIDRFYEAFQVEPTDALYIAPEKRAKIW